MINPWMHLQQVKLITYPSLTCKLNCSKLDKNNNVFNKIMMFKIAALLSKIWQFLKDIIDSKYSL